jgi:hypothetical protein
MRDMNAAARGPGRGLAAVLAAMAPLAARAATVTIGVGGTSS